jgi:hypothetical protein
MRTKARLLAYYLPGKHISEEKASDLTEAETGLNRCALAVELLVSSRYCTGKHDLRLQPFLHRRDICSYLKKIA